MFEKFARQLCWIKSKVKLLFPLLDLMAVTMFRGVPLWLCPCYVNRWKVLCDLWTSWNLSVVPVFNQPDFRHLGWKLVSRSTKMQRSHSWKAGKSTKRGAKLWAGKLWGEASALRLPSNTAVTHENQLSKTDWASYCSNCMFRKDFSI